MTLFYIDLKEAYMKKSKKACMAIITSLILILASPAMTALAARDNPECVHVYGVEHSTMYIYRTIQYPTYWVVWFRCHLCGYEYSAEVHPAKYVFVINKA